MLKNIFLLSAVALSTFSTAVEANSPEKDAAKKAVARTAPDKAKRKLEGENYSPAQKALSQEFFTREVRRPLRDIQAVIADEGKGDGEKKSRTLKGFLQQAISSRTLTTGLSCLDDSQGVHCLMGRKFLSEDQTQMDVSTGAVHTAVVDVRLDFPHANIIHLTGQEDKEELDFFTSSANLAQPTILIRTDTFAK